MMFKRILLPTDGSALSRQAATDGILLAKECGAEIVAVHVLPVPHDDQLDAWLHHDPLFAVHRQALFEKSADTFLSFVAAGAQAQQVRCVCHKAAAQEPYQAILDTARQERCDLIYMASHGWKGGAAQLLGSQTVKVLHYSEIPVLVHKTRGAPMWRPIDTGEAAP
jgi:nucleotide-binding universal stress UspA family protein